MCDYAAVYNSTEPVARKRHWCDECGMVIAPGDRYHYATYLYDGHWGTTKWCLNCLSIANFIQNKHGCVDFELWAYQDEIPREMWPQSWFDWQHDYDLEYGPEKRYWEGHGDSPYPDNLPRDLLTTEWYDTIKSAKKYKSWHKEWLRKIVEKDNYMRRETLLRGSIKLPQGTMYFD